MKLRLRSLQTKQTHKIELSDSSSLHNLKQILIQTLNQNPNQTQNPSSCASLQNLHLSLNQKDELLTDSSTEGVTTLQSLGITSGDLVLFTLNHVDFNSCSQDLVMTQLEIGTTLVTSKTTLVVPESSTSSVNKDAQKEEILKMDQNLVVELDSDVGIVEKSFSVHGFLRRVFIDELGDESGRDHKLLVIAIHTVLLDSGFVSYDVVGGKGISGFPFRKEWPLGLFNLRLFYTLPEILNSASNGGDSIMESVCLKFHNLGNSVVTVYGSLVDGNQSGVYRVSFDEEKLVPVLNVVWANCGLKEEVSFDAFGSGTNAEKEVFKFWRRVKDELALPMKIDLCEKSGIGLPACFMRLPTEIKMKILDTLPGVDVARVGSACSELSYLSSSDELWKKKYAEQFGDVAKAGDEGHWKRKFVRHWETNRKRRRVVGRYSVGRIPPPPRIPSVIVDHDIWQDFQIFGEDYDLLLPFGPL